ncbi:calcium and integrin-binding family member 2-like [Crassostrea virginica]
MGGGSSVFTHQEMDDYQELTYLTKKEIHHVYKRFRDIRPNDRNFSKHDKLNPEEIYSLPEFSVNPFKDRILRVFSSSGDGSMTFEDFLDMMSVFSDSAPLSIKIDYAFRIYDFDEDAFIGIDDIIKVIKRLIGDNCSAMLKEFSEERKKDKESLKKDPQQKVDEELKQVAESIVNDADLDNDGLLSLAEFEHVMGKTPEFAKTFRIRL